MKDRWSVPPLKMPGDDTEEITYAAVGYALTKWELLEFRLSQFYSRLTGKSPNKYETIVDYSKGATFRSRASTLKNALCAYSTSHHCQSLEGKILALIDEAIRASDRRNEIAHGVVRQFSWGVDFTTAREVNGQMMITVETTYYLVPAAYNSRYVSSDSGHKYAYTSQNIRAIGDLFANLTLEAEETLLSLPE